MAIGVNQAGVLRLYFISSELYGPLHEQLLDPLRDNTRVISGFLFLLKENGKGTDGELH